MAVGVRCATYANRIAGTDLLKLWTHIDMFTHDLTSFNEHLYDYRRNYTSFQQETARAQLQRILGLNSK